VPSSAEPSAPGVSMTRSFRGGLSHRVGVTSAVPRIERVRRRPRHRVPSPSPESADIPAASVSASGRSQVGSSEPFFSSQENPSSSAPASLTPIPPPPVPLVLLLPPLFPSLFNHIIRDLLGLRQSRLYFNVTKQTIRWK
jgi:hypothetical protein